ncbi:MAG: biopolymer transporter ExbD [Chthoniobacterales bacterium]|nr:biopolymer transporter ExbD [Chthoniobacterales bacterium]
MNQESRNGKQVPPFFFLLSCFPHSINPLTMRRYSSRTSLSTLSEINVTPLLDLAFVLLIIFMITTPLLENSKTLIIPSSATTNAPVNPATVQTLSMDRNEVVRLNEEEVDLASLEGRLAALKQADPNLAVVIRPDRSLPVQKLVSLMDALQRAEITKVGIATQDDSK